MDMRSVNRLSVSDRSDAALELLEDTGARGRRGGETLLVALQSVAGLVGLAALAIAIASLLLRPALARDLGVIGPVHQIAEQDMLDWIHARLKALEASGELGRRQELAQARALASVREPAAVPGLRAAQVAREYVFDPSIRFDEPVLDDKGRVVVPGGTVASPLDVVRMRSTWLFFDARDPRQVALADAEVAAAGRAGKVLKPILVAGSPVQLSERWRMQVYFDQGGLMVRRLGISAVPARVTQQGKYLRVEEVPAP
ncbi:MAG: type-F conjugative transfer system protein TraW [Rubrivivax sp.]|nr:type-F conjugative transfer system protein TraW [Rubrivivax sp.]